MELSMSQERRETLEFSGENNAEHVVHIKINCHVKESEMAAIDPDVDDLFATDSDTHSSDCDGMYDIMNHQTKGMPDQRMNINNDKDSGPPSLPKAKTGQTIYSDQQYLYEGNEDSNIDLYGNALPIQTHVQQSKMDLNFEFNVNTTSVGK